MGTGPRDGRPAQGSQSLRLRIGRVAGLELVRLRWEPTYEISEREGWRDAHDLAGIGGGWLWPNITIHTDGIHVLLAAKSSQPTRTELLSYTTDFVRSIPAAVFEAASIVSSGGFCNALTVARSAIRICIRHGGN